VHVLGYPGPEFETFQEKGRPRKRQWEASMGAGKLPSTRSEVDEGCDNVVKQLDLNHPNPCLHLPCLLFVVDSLSV
jgi:hypothetical protein